ncbi:ribokinase [Opitutaceae bacterium TAV4]|nr:ribokinase [Opitutaceae bacterium TAV4]RRK02453.1 ribokinase [Opitutaceae bacterium TAV3]
MPTATAPSSAYDVVVLGMNVVDILTEVPAIVTPDAKHEVEKILVQGGGPASTASCQIASLGWRTAFVGRHGRNTISAISEAEFARCGVLPDLFLRDDPDAQPAVAIVEVDRAKQQRTVFFSTTGCPKLTAAEVPVEAIRRARAILVDGYETAASRAALLAARDAGIRSVLDIEAGPPDTLRELLSLGTDAILPLAAALKLTGAATPADSLRALSRHTAAQLLITDGANGSWALDTGKNPDGEIHHQPAFPVNVIDTTGCGDCYHAAYLSALLSGWSLPLRMEFASWVAGYVAEALGGRTHLPTRAALRARDQSMLSPALRECLAGFLKITPTR